jgi:hypothetical protein
MSIVRILGERSDIRPGGSGKTGVTHVFGTGVILAERIIATAAANEIDNAGVFTASGKRIKAVILRDRGLDTLFPAVSRFKEGVALWKFRGGAQPITRRASSSEHIAIGSIVRIEGLSGRRNDSDSFASFLLGERLSPASRQAVVTDRMGDQRLIVTDCKSYPDATGAPLFDENKRLVGIVTNFVNDCLVATPIEPINKLIDRLV